VLAKASEQVGKSIHFLRGQLAACHAPVPQRVLVKGMHVHCILDGFASAAQVRIGRIASHLDNIDIQARRQPAVEPQFFFAKSAPRCQC
jgi:hypothetical protein